MWSGGRQWNCSGLWLYGGPLLTSKQIRKGGDALLGSISLLSLFFFFSAQAPSPWAAAAAAVPIQVELSSLSQSFLETLS